MEVYKGRIAGGGNLAFDFTGLGNMPGYRLPRIAVWLRIRYIYTRYAMKKDGNGRVWQ